MQSDKLLNTAQVTAIKTWSDELGDNVAFGMAGEEQLVVSVSSAEKITPELTSESYKALVKSIQTLTRQSVIYPENFPFSSITIIYSFDNGSAMFATQLTESEIAYSATSTLIDLTNSPIILEGLKMAVE